MFSTIGGMLTGFLQKTIDGLGTAFQGIVNILPSSPFALVSNAPVEGILGKINWFLPLNEMVSILQAWTTVIIFFYIYKVVLRWVRAIQ